MLELSFAGLEVVLFIFNSIDGSGKYFNNACVTIKDQHTLLL
jgi:hypothetical protein